MPRPLLAACVLLLAGCLAPAADLPDAGGDAAAVELRAIDVAGCTMAIGYFPVALQEAVARLPEGFTPAPYGAAAPGFARGGAWIWTCDTINGTQGAWGDAWVSLLVTPPAAWTVEGASFHAVLLEGANERADMVARYAAWNVATSVGEVELTHRGGTATLATARAQLASGPLSLDLQGGPVQRRDAGVVRAFAAVDRVVTGAFEYHWTPFDVASGTMTMDEGASAFGASSPLVGQGGLESGEGYAFSLRPVVLPPLE